MEKLLALPKSREDVGTMDADAPSVASSLPIVQVREPPAAKPVSKILFLDGLRGLAAMMVVSDHAGYFRKHNMGAPAVDTFFVLSAFLLTLIFERKARQLLTQGASYARWGLALTDYFTRRFLRVYPLFAIVATVLAVLPPKERTRSLKMDHPEKYKLLRVLTFKGDSHPHILWSLPVEISYYLLIPVFAVVSINLRRRWWILALAGFAVVFYSGFCLWRYRQRHDLLTAHYPTLLCGSLGAQVFGRIDHAISTRGFVWTTSRVYALRFVELAFAALLLSNLFNGLLFHLVAKKPFPEDANHFVSFPVTVLVVCEMLRRGPISSVLEWSLLRFAGKVSFSMYLLHIFVVYAPFLTHATFYDRFFLLWTLVFALSTASFYTVEQPCQQLAARLGKWIKWKDAAAAAADAKAASQALKRLTIERELAHATDAC